MEVLAKMKVFTKRSRGFSLLEMLVSLSIFSVILLVILMSFRVNSDVISSTYNKNNKTSIENHLIKFMETEINNASEIRFDGDNYYDYDKSLGFILVKYPDQGSNDYQYTWYVVKDNNIHRYTYSSKDGYDKLKNRKIRANNKNIIDEDLDEISIQMDGENLILNINSRTKVIDISNKAENNNEK